MAGSPKKVIVVEDSPMMQKMYRMALGQDAGTEVVFARNGVEGLDRAAQELGVELFIVDINMPQMDGLEFLRRLRGELGITDVPAIVVSTEGEETDRADAREAGADGYLHKPWTPDELLNSIRGLKRGQA